MKILIVLITVHILCSIVAKKYIKLIFSMFKSDFETKGVSQDRQKFYGNLFAHTPIFNIILCLLWFFFTTFSIIIYLIKKK